MTDLPLGLQLDRQDAIAIISLNRPEKLNALTRDMYFGLDQLVRELSHDDDVSVILLTGVGRAFCAGVDMGDFISDLVDTESPRFEPPPGIHYFAGVEKPIVTAINGICAAAGTELLLASDIRLAFKDAWFGLAEVTVGMVPSGGAHTRLPRQVPWAIAMELLLTGNRITAERAYQVGLVNEIVDAADDLMPRALAVCKRIAENSPTAVQLAKRIALAGLQLGVSYQLESALSRAILDSPDALEGYTAFKEGRAPDFSRRTSNS